MAEAVTQGELRPDVEAIRRYGEAHPDAFVQVLFEGVGLVVLVAGSDEDVALHEAALRAVVTFPNQLKVRHSPWSARRLEEIRQEIMSSYEGAWHGIGSGRGVVNVSLWADQLDVAEELHRRYGDAVELQVGYLAYPDHLTSGSGRPASASEPAELPLLPDGVQLSFPEDFTVRSGGKGHTILTVRNNTGEEVRAMTNGGIQATVVDPVAGHAVGGYEGALAAPLVVFTAAPGASCDIPVLVGTASLRPELGWAVPPGRWALRFILQVDDVNHVRLLPLDVTV
jgi:hypothetical protein